MKQVCGQNQSPLRLIDCRILRISCLISIVCPTPGLVWHILPGNRYAFLNRYAAHKPATPAPRMTMCCPSPARCSSSGRPAVACAVASKPNPVIPEYKAPRPPRIPRRYKNSRRDMAPVVIIISLHGLGAGRKLVADPVD